MTEQLRTLFRTSIGQDGDPALALVVAGMLGVVALLGARKAWRALNRAEIRVGSKGRRRYVYREDEPRAYLFHVALLIASIAALLILIPILAIGIWTGRF